MSPHSHLSSGVELAFAAHLPVIAPSALPRAVGRGGLPCVVAHSLTSRARARAARASDTAVRVMQMGGPCICPMQVKLLGVSREVPGIIHSLSHCGKGFERFHQQGRRGASWRRPGAAGLARSPLCSRLERLSPSARRGCLVVLKLAH